MTITQSEEENKRCQVVAAGIFRQIFITVDRLVFASWGVSKKFYMWWNEMPSLMLKDVNGAVHKGDVVISLNEGADTYEIRLLDKQKKMIDLVADVYSDNLGIVLDGLIERPASATDEEYRKMLDEQGAFIL